MALVEMARHTAFANPAIDLPSTLDDHVCLQLQFGERSHGTRAVFACQFVVRQTDWEKTKLGGDLKKALARNLIGQVELKHDQLFPDGRGVDLHFVSIFDRNVQMRINGTPTNFDLNVKVRVLDFEQRVKAEKPVWLVKAEILSGGLKCPKADTDFRPRAFFDEIVWPQKKHTQQDKVLGIHFTDSELQIDVADHFNEQQRLRRFRLLDVRRDRDGRVDQTLWEQTYGRPRTSTALQLESPSTTLKAQLEALFKRCEDLGIVMFPRPSPGDLNVSGRVIAHVDFAKNDMREFFSTTKSLRFRWKSAKSEGATTDWQPKTIFVEEESFCLIDTDEVAATIRGDAPSDTGMPADDDLSVAHIVWKTGQQLKIPVLKKLPSAGLVGVSSGRADPAKDLWFQASSLPANGSPYANQPICWAHMVASEPAGLPLTQASKSEALQRAHLSDPIELHIDEIDKTYFWNCQITPSNTAPAAPELNPRPKLLLRIKKKAGNNGDEQADLVVFQPDITVKSPPLELYNRPIADPEYVPNERAPHEKAKVVETSLQFERQAGFKVSSETVQCKLLPGVGVEIEHPDRALEMFFPASQALVDPVSVTAGNLVARQTVAFRLVSIDRALPTDPRPIQLTRIRRETNAVIADLEITLTANATLAPKLVGFFAELVGGSDNEPEVRCVVRLREIGSITANKLTLTVDVSPTFDDLKVGRYSMLVGPTRLALPRDVNHGLICIGLKKCRFGQPIAGRPLTPRLTFALGTDTATELRSVLALHPWSEWGPTPNEWLKTGRIRLHHRNLIQEHAEFESSFEDRFPPEGPPPAGNGPPSPLLPLDDFIRAVRDRYTEASGNLLVGAGKQIANWLPGAKLLKDDGSDVERSLTFEDSRPTAHLPSTKLDDQAVFESQSLKLRRGPFRIKAASWSADKEVRFELFERHGYPPDTKVVVEGMLPDGFNGIFTATPDSYGTTIVARLNQDPGAATGFGQVFESGLDKQWLDTNVRVESISLSEAPKLLLRPTDITAVDSHRALNSSVSLLFNRHEVTVLAAALQGDQPILVWGSPSTNPQVGRYLAGNLESQKELAANPLSCAAAMTVEGKAYVGVVAADGAIKVLRVNDDLSTDTLEITAAPAKVRAIVGGAARGTPRFAVIAGTTSSVMVIESEGGDHKTWNAVSPPVQDDNPTSVALTDSDAGGILVVGYPGGRAVLWRHTAGSWKRVVDLPKPDAIEPNSIRSIAVAPAGVDVPKLFVIGCNGTRDVTRWEVMVGGSLVKASPDTRASEALAVVAGSLNDLELRGGDQKYLNFFAIGYRSGEVELHGAQDDETRPIRGFDSPAPVVGLAVIQSPTKKRTAVPMLVVGSPDGNVLVWDLRSGFQFASPERIAPTHYFDGLGVTRQVAETPGEDPTGKAPLIEKLRSNVEGVNLKSISVDEFVLSLSETSETHDVTDIRFWSDSLKIDGSGKPFQRAFDDDRWFPGRCGFYSQVRVPDDRTSRDDQNLRSLNCLPRLGGIPLFVTHLHHITTSRETIRVNGGGVERDVTIDWISEIQFDAVLLNPDEVAAGFDPADEGTTPGYVRQALSRDSVISVKVSNMSPGETSQVEIVDLEKRKSSVDWIFAVNRQRPRRDLTAGFPGSIARIKSKSVSFENGQVKIVVDLSKSRALVFGRLWKFSDGEIELIGAGRFQTIQEDAEANIPHGWQPLDFEFRSTLPSAVDKPIQVFPEDNQDDLVAIKGSPFAWDTDGNIGRFIPIIPKDSGVLLVDRITGLADPQTRRFIGEDLYNNSAKFTSVAIIETAGQVTLAAARARGMVRVGEVDVEVGDVEFYFHSQFDAYGRPATDPASQPKRLAWRSTLLAGDKPVVKLARIQTTSGAIAAASLDNGILQLELEDDSPFPAPGQLIGLKCDNNECLSGFVLTHERSFITLAKNVEWGGPIPAAQYLQPAAHVTDIRIAGNDTVVTAEHLDRNLQAGDFVAIGTQTAPPCVEVKTVNGREITIATTDAIKIGGRLFGVRRNTDGEIGETLSLKTWTDGLKPGCRVRLHDLTASTAELRIAGAVAAGAVDLYAPVATPAPADPTKFFWRAVSPIAGFLSDGAAGLRIPGHGLAVGAKIRVAAVQVDGGSPLNRDWVAIPRPDDPTNLVLLGLPKEGNAPTSAGGTWIRKGLADPKAIAVASNPGPGKPIVITTEVDHDLEPGELVEIAGVEGNTAANGGAIVGVVTPNTFELYSITEPPTSPVGGDWGASMDVLTARRELSSLRITSNRKPTLGQRVRVTDNGVESDVLNAVVLKGNRNTWDLAKAITTPLADFARSGWSLPNPIRLNPQSADGQTTLQLLAEGASLPFGQALLLLDDGGANPAAGKMLVADPRDVDTLIMLEEVSDAFPLSPPDRWEAKTADTLAVVNPGGRQLFFGKPKGESTDLIDPPEPPGSTSRDHQQSNIEHFGVGLCGPVLAAATVDGTNVKIWSLEEIKEKTEPTATIPINNPILGLAVGQAGPLLLIAVATANVVDVFIGGDPSGPFERVTIAATGVANNPLIAVCTDAEAPVIILGRKSSKNISTWTLDLASRTPSAYVKVQTEFPAENLVAGTLDRGLQLLVQTTNDRVSRWGKNSWLHFSSRVDVTFAPQAALDVDVEYNVAAVGEILATLTPARDVQFTLPGKPAHARLLQDIGRCFTLAPTSANAARGKETLVLWPVGDLSIDSIPTASPLQLGAMHAVLEQKQVPVELKMDVKNLPGAAVLQGAYLSYVVAASLGRGNPVFHRSSTLVAEGTLGSDRLTIILEGSSEGPPGESAEFTGTLLCDRSPSAVPTSQFQATVRANVTFEANKVVVALVDDTYWTAAAMPRLSGAKASIFLPVGLSESAPPPDFAIVPFEVDNTVEGNFVRLRFVSSGNSPGVQLKTNGKGSIPLIPDLELDKVAPPPRQARNTVSLTHRLRAGVALRPNLPTDPFTEDRSDFTAKEVTLAEQTHWLLEPIVDSQSGSLIRIRPEAWLVPQASHGVIQHIDPIPIGRKQGAVIATRPHSLASPQRVRLRNSKGKSVEIVELHEVTNEDQVVGKFSAFITRAVEKRIRKGSWEVLERPRRETDGLLIAVRMPSGPEASRALGSFIVALDSRTHVDEIPPATLDLEAQGQYRQLLRDTGVRGVSVQYRLEDSKTPDFAFVASPFFDHGDRETTLSVDGIRAAVSATASQNTIVQILDRFLVLPGVAASESQAVESRYTPDSTPVDPYADVCCLAHRMFRLRRIGVSPAFSNKQIPVVHLSTVPAFRQSAPLLPAARRNWRRTETGPLGPCDGNHVFFPPTLDWTIAADKPGAMFHALVQPRVQDRNRSDREPVLDFAQREPQFIRIKPCVTAAVAWESVTPETKPDTTHIDLVMKWEETIGSAKIDVADQFTIKQVSPREFKFVERPLQLIESFNGEVIAVQPADAAVPAYRVVAQTHPDIGTPTDTVQPADTYLVADKDVDIFAAKTLERTGDATISPVNVGGLANVAKFESEELKGLRDGEILTLSGFGEDSGLNGRRVRVVSRVADDIKILCEDTARISFATDDISLAPEGGAPAIGCDAGNAGTIERPLSLKPRDYPPPSGMLVTVPPNTVANARTGEPITQCICWLEGETIVLLAPLIVAASEEKQAQIIASVVPYFEASPRVPNIDITISRNPIWLGALRIEKRTDDDAKMLPIDIDWIRCESAMIPELTGIFRTLPIKGETTLRQLVHPSLIPKLFGDSGEIPVEGVLKLFDESPGSASITVVDLRPGLPARIKVEGADINLLHSGCAVSVELTKVGAVERSGTPLDGMWVIERLEVNGDLWLDLFTATIAPPVKDGTSKVVVSRVFPLTEAFKSRTDQGGYSLATLNTEVCDFWIPTSRPLLQVQWAGLRTEPNADGSKLTPRQVGLLIPLFEDPKQIKFLANSQLSPKLSFVLSAGRTDAADRFALQRTILFGDSAPPFGATPTIEGDLFVLKIPHNKEELSVETPANMKLSGAKLFLVKSLPSGVLVYAEHIFP